MMLQDGKTNAIQEFQKANDASSTKLQSKGHAFSQYDVLRYTSCTQFKGAVHLKL